jgi:hypothetical protein
VDAIRAVVTAEDEANLRPPPYDGRASSPAKQVPAINSTISSSL